MPNQLYHLLKGYPNKEFLYDGFSNGFLLGFIGEECAIFGSNRKSITDNLEVAQSKIDHEISLNRISGPFDSPPFDNFKISPLALRQKKEPNKFRLLHNLSYPYDSTSVNFNIHPDYATVQYDSLNSAIKIIQNHYPCYLAKTDIADAFRIIPLHASQYHLTGFKFMNKYYYDKCLPQGCSSSCFIFEQFSDSLKWILSNHYNIHNVVKVLDDFLFINNNYNESKQTITKFSQLCNNIGVPIAEHKTEGPSQCITFLGIELNTISRTAKLPKDKLIAYKEHIEDMMLKNKCTLSEMKSLIGKLQFATSVIPVGKCFLRRLHNSTIGITKPYFYIRLNNDIKEDLLIWIRFLSFYNGITIITPRESLSSNDLHMFTDSCIKGYGGTFGSDYVCGLFPESWQLYSIEFLELYPIFLLIHIFANKLSNKRVIFHCDNNSIVQIINKQSSKCKNIMFLLRPLILTMLNYNILFSAIHIPGVHNKFCDDLSRSQITLEKLQAYGMKRYATPIPNHLRPQNLKMTSLTL